MPVLTGEKTKRVSMSGEITVKSQFKKITVKKITIKRLTGVFKKNWAILHIDYLKN